MAMLIPYDIHDEPNTELNDNPEFQNASILASRLQVRTVYSMSLCGFMGVVSRVSYIFEFFIIHVTHQVTRP